MDDQTTQALAGGTSPDTGTQTAGEGSTLLGGAQTAPPGNQAQTGGAQPPAGGTQDQTGGAPEAYDFTKVVPDGMEYDAQAAASFGALAKENGLSQAQAEKIAAYGMNFMQQGATAAMEAVASQMAEETKAALGKDFQGTMQQAAVARDALITKVPGLKEALDNPLIGNNVGVARLLAAVAPLLGEDRGMNTSGGAPEKSIYTNTNFDLYQ